MAQLRLLACFAHPDDEAFTASGVLAASTARGVQVRLVCATCGTVAVLGREYLIQAHPPVPAGTPLAIDFLDGLS